MNQINPEDDLIHPSINMDPVDSYEYIAKAGNLRAFYFIVVVWGERYTDFLLNFCIAALLSPKNIPSLHNRAKNKFLISTTQEDWDSMQQRPIFVKLRQYLEPILVVIPPCPEGMSGCIHMGVGHKLATQIAFRDRAYAVLLTPDLMLSDGTIAAVQRRAVEGYHVVLTAAMRFGEEPLFEHLDKLGIANIRSKFADEGKPLIASGRQLVWAGIKSFHSETLKYEFNSDYFSYFPVACWWKSPGSDGILIYSLSWAPLLVDYDAVKSHDVTIFENWTIDGDYIYKNFGNSNNVYVCDDSDEMMLVSWAPMNDRPQSLLPNRILQTKILGLWIRKLIVYETFYNNVFDPLKRKIFLQPVRWHSQDVDAAWNILEFKSKIILHTAIGYDEKQDRPSALSVGNFLYFVNKFFSIYSRNILKFILCVMRILIYFWIGKWRILKVAYDALLGDPIARKRVLVNITYIKSQFMGKDL